MDTQPRTAEEVAGGIARGQHGVVTRSQLLAAGLSVTEIGDRLRKGVLIGVHRGVYRVGHRAPSVEARYLAAVLASGEGALLSGRSAAWLLGLVRGEAPPPEVATRSERRVPGVRTRRCRALGEADGTTHRGIPTTTPARTLTDLAAILPLDALARACHEAGIHHRTTPSQVEAVLARRSNAKGAANLRTILSGDTRVTLSELEARFLRLLREAELPLPSTNKPAGSKRVDCRWPEHQLTVELDGYRFHNSRHAWEQDRRREREAYARGDQLRRYTYGDAFERPQAMLAELRTLLAPG
jgi:very-short-patch-repair endonuclease